MEALLNHTQEPKSYLKSKHIFAKISFNHERSLNMMTIHKNENVYEKKNLAYQFSKPLNIKEFDKYMKLLNKNL